MNALSLLLDYAKLHSAAKALRELIGFISRVRNRVPQVSWILMIAFLSAGAFAFWKFRSPPPVVVWSAPKPNQTQLVCEPAGGECTFIPGRNTVSVSNPMGSQDDLLISHGKGTVTVIGRTYAATEIAYKTEQKQGSTVEPGFQIQIEKTDGAKDGKRTAEAVLTNQAAWSFAIRS